MRFASGDQCTEMFSPCSVIDVGVLDRYESTADGYIVSHEFITTLLGAELYSL